MINVNRENVEIGEEVKKEENNEDGNVQKLYAKIFELNNKMICNINDLRPFISSRINNKEVSWLVDTGAAISLLDYEIVKDFLHQMERVESSNIGIESATGHGFMIIGEYLAEIKIEEKTFVHKVTVVQGLRSGAILGADFLQKFDVLINMKEKSIKFQKFHTKKNGIFEIQQSKKVDDEAEENSHENLRALAVNDKIVPAHCESRVAIRRERHSPAGDYIATGLGVPTALVNFESRERTFVTVRNTSAVPLHIKKNDQVAMLELTQPGEGEPFRVEELMKSTDKKEKECQRSTLSKNEEMKKLQFLKDNARTDDMNATQREKFLALIFKYEDVFSGENKDLGHATAIPHRIRLKEKDRPIHVKQFRVPWAHQEFIEQYVDDLLDKGCLEPSRSAFNAPVFCVPKPHGGGLRIVLDYRRLNDATIEDKYMIREVQECIDEIGKNNSTVFSTLDLTSGFWQQELEPASREATAFSIPGRGRFQWTRSPMGLHGSPSSFSRLMDHVAEGAKGLITYLDDILVHATSFEEHLAAMEECFRRLRKFNLKLNIKKCDFIAKKVPYLGFILTPEGVLPSEDKMKAIREFPTPKTIRQIREITGMTNYFRHLIPNYSLIAGKLTRLLGSKANWEGGKLPDEARKAFEMLKEKLITAPVVAYPSMNKEFILTTDAATGDATNPGGLGAVLTQIDDQGVERVVRYGSRSLRDHEKNYGAYLLEMAAACWGIEHFHTYLYGRKFVLQTDHKPLEKLSTRHNKTLNNLQEKMIDYNFVMQYKKGVDNVVADTLSRNPVEAIEETGLTRKNLRVLQAQDNFCASMMTFLDTGKCTEDTNDRSNYIRKNATQFTIRDKLLFKLEKDGRREELRSALVLPKALIPEVLKAGHCSKFGGHFGPNKTILKIRQTYWWPRMQLDVEDFTSKCFTCQQVKRPFGYKAHRVPTGSLPVPDAPNIRVHIDLFGPLKRTEGGKGYLLVMTDAFTKYADIAIVDSKSAEAVGNAFYRHWICRFSVPEHVVSDNGREFCGQLSEKLYKLLGIQHDKTAVYNPQCNTSAESFNRVIKGYLKSVLEDGETLEWEKYIPPLLLAYNTAIHKTTQNSPFFLTFLHEPRLPYFDLQQQQVFYTDDFATDAYGRLKKVYKAVKEHSEKENAKSRAQNNKQAKHKEFAEREAVLVAFPNTKPGGNPKFEKPYKPGFEVEKRIGEYTYIIRNVSNGHRHTVHADLLKSQIGDNGEKENYYSHFQAPKILSRKLLQGQLSQQKEEEFSPECADWEDEDDELEIRKEEKQTFNEEENAPSDANAPDRTDFLARARVEGRHLRSRGPVNSLPNVQTKILERKPHSRN